MGSNRRVVKFRRRRSLNIGVIIFLILFLYIIINVYLYFTKEHMSIYEVQEGTTVEDNLVTGLILRDEKIITSANAGYISFFYEDSAKIAKNSSVYSVDDSQQILEVITSSDEPFAASKENSARFRFEIDKFQSSYSDSNFKPVYQFKEDAKSTVMDLLNQAMIEKGQKIQDETGLAYSYQVVNSQESGIITYYIDSYETVAEEAITPDMFETDNYERISLRTTDMVPQNSPIYKLITSEDWFIYLPLTKKQYEKLIDKTRVSFTILKDDFKTTADLSLFTKGSDYYAKLSMDKHLTNYLQDRHLNIQLHLDAVEGLKIPLSAIIEKDFYMVPLEYFTVGADSGKNGIIKENFDSETGEVKYTFVAADIYYQDDLYGYIDTRLFQSSSATRIKSPKGPDSFQLFQTGKLTGVYNVNTGYAVFKRIEILYQNEAYCIVKKNTSYGLSLYDHIALDGSTAVEQAIIY